MKQGNEFEGTWKEPRERKLRKEMWKKPRKKLKE